MPVTPTPRTIPIDLSEEYLDFLDMATRAGSLSRQQVMREALAMLKDADLTPEQLRSQLVLFGKRHAGDLKQPALAAWDRWTENRGQQLPLPDNLAAFIDELLADGVAYNATGIVMLALLRYGKVMGFLFTEDWNEDPGES
ncbi:MAG TPA: hypothetical protein VKU02_19790 [Gemmataceae bacterium]|nr:hypothetical protein [Gemmataceae bacterium]